MKRIMIVLSMILVLCGCQQGDDVAASSYVREHEGVFEFVDFSFDNNNDLDNITIRIIGQQKHGALSDKKFDDTFEYISSVTAEDDANKRYGGAVLSLDADNTDEIYDVFEDQFGCVLGSAEGITVANYLNRFGCLQGYSENYNLFVSENIHLNHNDKQDIITLVGKDDAINVTTQLIYNDQDLVGIIITQAVPRALFEEHHDHFFAKGYHGKGNINNGDTPAVATTFLWDETSQFSNEDLTQYIDAGYIPQLETIKTKESVVLFGFYYGLFEQ